MGRVFVDFDEGVPRFACTDCIQCASTMGISLCTTKNRGCCYYFPKFTLVDIHRMAVSLEGLQVLNTIVENPGTIVHDYYIHAKGTFDERAYQEYMKSGQLIGDGTIEDHSIFFKTCPFVKEGHGCTIPPRYRTYVCNFFICNEIIGGPTLHDAFEPYVAERSSYVKWIEWENASLQHVLKEHHVSLVKDFDKTIQILQKTPLNCYDFPNLESVDVAYNWCKGA